MLTAYDWPHHDCLFDYFAIRNCCVSTQRLHHCVSAWPCGQALSLSFGPLATRVTRRAATFPFCISAWPSCQAHVFYPSARSPPALRGASACLIYSNRDALSGWPHLHDCLQITLRSGNGCVSTQRLHHCVSAWPLAAKRFLSLTLDRLPPALRGVSVPQL